MKKTNKYIINGKSVPGVTTIINWRMPKGLCIGFYGKNTPKKAKEISDAGKDFGSMVHSIISAYISGQEQILTKEQQTILDNFKLVTEGWEWLESEKVVLNPEHMFGGTADGIVKIDGKKTLIDIKTGGLYEKDHVVQLAAYKECLSDIEQCKIIHLDKDTLTFEVLDIETDGAFEIFLAFKLIYDYEKGY